MWNGPFNVIFMKDGTKLLDGKVKSIKVDISVFIKKYKIKPPKFIAELPDDYIRTQKTFFERAYLELLEYCSDKLDDRAADDDVNEKVVFKTIYSADGQHLKTL